MSQPAPYHRSFSFSNFQAANPTAALPGSQVDLELNNVKSSIDGIESNLKRIQRDDGGLANSSVTFDALSPSLQTAGIAPALPWVAGTAYSVGASVTHGSAFYRCLIAHTSGVFATDLAAGDWILIIDFSTIALVAASMIAVTPSGSLTTDVQTSLQALDAGKAPTSHTHVSSAISDSTTAGRALLTAPDVATQNALLGTTLLGFQSGGIQQTAALMLPAGWYWADGSIKNRVTDASLFNAITIQQSGVLVSASAVVTGLDTTNGGNTPIAPGMPVSGTGIPTGTVIQSVDSSSQVTLSQAATLSATTPLVFAPYGVGDGSTSFNLPNLANVAVGRDNASGSASNINQISTTISTTNASATATVGSATGIVVGMFVNHPKIPFGTKISAISGTTLTLSAAATATTTTSAVRFSPLADAQTLGATGGSVTRNTTLVTANLPPYTPAGGVGVSGSGTAPVQGGYPGTTLGGVAAIGTNSSGVTSIPLSLSLSGSFAGTPQGGTSTPIQTQTMQPTIVMNFIIKR